MKTSKFERLFKRNVKSNGNFASIFKRVNANFESKQIYCIKQKKNKLLVPFISVGAVLAQTSMILLTISLIANINNRQHHNATNNQSTTNKTEPQSGDLVKEYKKYQWFVYANQKYICPDLNYEYISKDLVGETLGELEIVATHSLGPQMEKTKISIKSISNIDANYGIAVKFEGENEYYLYVVETLGLDISLKDFLDASGLSKYGVFVSASYTYLDGENNKTVVSDKVDTTIKEILKRNEEVKNIFSPDPSSPYCSFSTDISVKITMPSLGNTSTCFDINLDGRSRFSLINQNTYLINIDDTIALKDFILNNIS